MTPTHTNKKGVRYSYYVSQAMLQKQSAVLIGRVAAPELEALVVDAVRRHVQANSTASNPIVETDRELIERHLLRATLSRTAITLHLRQDIADAEASGAQDLPDRPATAPTTVTIPWTAPAAAPVKGIVHVPAHNTPMKPGSRETLLMAVARPANGSRASSVARRSPRSPTGKEKPNATFVILCGSLSCRRASSARLSTAPLRPGSPQQRSWPGFPIPGPSRNSG
jgi:hypothetical protein